MKNPQTRPFTGIEFITLTGDIITSAARNAYDPTTMFEFIALGLEDIENACFEAAALLPESDEAGYIFDDSVSYTVTRLVNNGQQIKLYIRESEITSQEDVAKALVHWSDYPDEIQENMSEALLEQICAWRSYARDSCAANGQLVLPYDRKTA